MPIKKRPPIEDLQDVSQEELASRPPIDELEEVSPDEISGFEKAMNVMDIPASLVRTGVSAAISPEQDVLPALSEQFQKTIQSPTTAAMQAPSGTEINQLIDKEILGVTPEEVEAKYKEFPTASKIMKGVSGFVTETALDPFTAIGMVPKVRRVVNAPITSAADRQAAKVLSQYASKSDVMSKGKDVTIAAKRLVEEDLQGMLRNPPKLYQHLSGSVKIDKIAPESLDTLKIVKGKSKKGLIGRLSEDVTDVIKRVEEANPELSKKRYPLDAVISVVRANAEKNMSKISAETVDIDRIGKILNDTLKPFEDISSGIKEVPYLEKMPGSLDLREGIKLIKGEPVRKVSNLSISELQQLRKNVGKLVSDRTFYAKADQGVKMEAEVLSDVYRQLGDMIKADLRGIKVRKGSRILDAEQFYEAQNNRIKQLMDVESLLEYTPNEKLKQADFPATLLSALTQGGIMGATGVAGEAMGLPYSSSIGLGGAGLSMAATAGKAVKENAPEYLTSILATAAKVPPNVYPRAAIQYMREGKPVQESEMGRFPQSESMLSPKEIINYKIPKSTEGILANKRKVIAKLLQNDVPEEMVNSFVYALDKDPEAVPDITSLMLMQFPNLFERTKYKMFDGKFMGGDGAKAADDISRRDDLNSLQKAKMIDMINKNNKVPEGL